VQSDPIGLKGGLATYSYVGNSPLGASDIRGESGNSNSFSGDCHVYYRFNDVDNTQWKVGESCQGKNKKGESIRCERQATDLTKTTGKKHSCKIVFEKKCTKGEIKTRETRRRDALRGCGCPLYGNKEYKRGKK